MSLPNDLCIYHALSRLNFIDFNALPTTTVVTDGYYNTLKENRRFSDPQIRLRRRKNNILRGENIVVLRSRKSLG